MKRAAREAANPSPLPTATRDRGGRGRVEEAIQGVERPVEETAWTIDMCTGKFSCCIIMSTFVIDD